MPDREAVFLGGSRQIFNADLPWNPSRTLRDPLAFGSWEVQTDQVADDAREKILIAHADEPLTPGATVKFQGTAGTKYSNTVTLTVTEDGCMLNGTFADTDGNAGSIHFLYESPRFYVPGQ